MKRMHVLVLLSLLPCITAGAAGAPPGSGAPAEGLPIPFTLRANTVVLPVRVGGSRVLQVVLDSGMGFDGLLLYDSSLLDSSELRKPFRARIGGAGSGPPQTARVADSMSFEVGGVDFADQRIVLLEGDAMKGFASDGVIGRSLFGRHAVEIDYHRMVLTLHRPGGFRPSRSWTALPLTFKESGIPWLEVGASLDGSESVSLSCYIDLASREALELLTREGGKFRTPRGLKDEYLGRGLSGDIFGKKGKVAWVQLGPHRLKDVAAAFTPAEVRSKQPGADAVIGNGLLRRFNCVFDYRAGRLYLEPNEHFAEPY
jgi:hypothetical protein